MSSHHVIVLSLLLFTICCVAGQQRAGIDLDNMNGPPHYNKKNPQFMRFLVIGDIGRQLSKQSVGLPECPVDDFGGDKEVEGGAQQRETAFQMDTVCGLIGGCQFVVNTGDNFYACGVYPGDDTRLVKDWQEVYKRPEVTPNIANLKWYNTFGNHDIRINGSVEQEIAFSKEHPDWVMPSANFYHDWTFANVTLRGIFFDTSPFVTKYYQEPTKTYFAKYLEEHHSAGYAAATISFVRKKLAGASTYTFLTTHYPMFGTSTQYGKPGEPDSKAGVKYKGWPGEHKGWKRTMRAIKTFKPVAYFNGHDHTMTLGQPIKAQDNNYTSYFTSGAGSWGETGDSCGPSDSYLYTNGGNGGFLVVTASTKVFRTDYYTLGSNFPQCTVYSFADKKRAPTYSAGCAAGKPNTCCDYTGSAPSATCF